MIGYQNDAINKAHYLSTCIVHLKISTFHLKYPNFLFFSWKSNTFWKEPNCVSRWKSISDIKNEWALSP